MCNTDLHVFNHPCILGIATSGMVHDPVNVLLNGFSYILLGMYVAVVFIPGVSWVWVPNTVGFERATISSIFRNI